MKKNMTPVFEVKWWDTNQPKGLSSARDLKTALTAYERAYDELKKSSDQADLKPAQTALDKLKPAVDGVIAEAEKMRKGTPPKGVDPADLEATVEVLKKFARLYDTERTELGKLVSAEDEDEANAFTDPVEYKKYLLKGLRKLATGDPMNFGIALGKTATAHRIALSKSKGPAGLAKLAIDATGLHVATFGIAVADQARPDTIVLALEGKQIPGLKKKADRMLKAFKPLPFGLVVLKVNGQEVADIVDPDDTDTDDAPGSLTDPATAPATATDSAPAPAAAPPVVAQLRAGMERVVPMVRQAVGAHPERRGEIMAPVSAFQQQMQVADYPGAKQSLTDLVGILKSVNSGPAAAAASAVPPGAPPYAELMADWTTARTTVANDLQKLEAAILEQFKDQPEFASIQQNVRKLDTILTILDTGLLEKLNAALAAPADARAKLHQEALAEVTRYRGFVESDALVAAVETNPFTPVALKSPVSATLDQIEKALAA